MWLEVRSPNVYQSRFERSHAGARRELEHRRSRASGSTARRWRRSRCRRCRRSTSMDACNTSSTIRTAAWSRRPRRVFPQLYLPALIKLVAEPASAGGEQRARRHRAAAQMQHPSGGFAYWPGVWSTDAALEWRNDWGTTYAGHFMLEAEKAGYALPGDMKAAWVRFQKERAQRWTPRRYQWPDEKEEVAIEAARYEQAYRLFTLALAGQPEIGAMNRLRESRPYSIGERWMLASAYKLAGKADVANELAQHERLQAFVFSEPNAVHLRLAAARPRGGADGPDAAGPRRRCRTRCSKTCRRSCRMSTGTARSRCRSRWWRWRRTRARSRSRNSASTTPQATWWPS